MQILAVSGSLREDSYNTSLLRELRNTLASTHDWTELDPALTRQLPAFDADEEVAHANHPAVMDARERFARADAVIFATPEYNGSIPGGLKNLLDWLSRPFDSNPLRNSPVAVLSASDGQFGAVWANNDLRRVLTTMGARMLERQIAVPMAHLQFDELGRLRNEGTKDQLAALASDLHDLVAALGRSAGAPHGVVA